jgi:hypothetical protein
MAIWADADEGRTDGVYEWLLEQLEQKCARRAEFVDAVGGGFFRDPNHARLEAMRCREPVDVPGYMLPKSVRDGVAYRSASRGVGRYGNPIVRSLTVTVRPDGRITYDAETAQEWLEQEMPGETVSRDHP